MEPNNKFGESLESRNCDINKLPSDTEIQFKHLHNTKDKNENKSENINYNKPEAEKLFDSKNEFEPTNQNDNHTNLASSLSFTNKLEDEKYICKKVASFENSTKNIYVFNTMENKISKVTLDLPNIDIKKLESYHSSLNYKDMFYISGGINKNAKMFYRYDMENNKLTKLKDMINGHSYHGLCSYSNVIFAISGFKSKKCERYSIENNVWIPLPDISFSRSMPSCTVIQEKIYIFAGYDDISRKCIEIIERYDLAKPHSTSWETIDLKLNEGFPFYSGLISLTNELLFIGGKNSIESEPCKSVWMFKKIEHVFEKTKNTILNNDEFDGKNFVLIGENKYGLFSSIFPNTFIIYEKDGFFKETYN
jgi:hypothetical protein